MQIWRDIQQQTSSSMETLGNDLTTIELTCCFETNLVKSNKFKKEKYDKLDKKLKSKLNLNKLYIEVTSLGLTPKTNRCFDRFLKSNSINSYRMNRKICEVALRSSYYIYTQRNYNWKEIDILLASIGVIFFFCIRTARKICFSLDKLIYFNVSTV